MKCWYASSRLGSTAISQSWPLAHLPEAMRALMAGTLRGKAVIKVRKAIRHQPHSLARRRAACGVRGA